MTKTRLHNKINRQIENIRISATSYRINVVRVMSTCSGKEMLKNHFVFIKYKTDVPDEKD